MSENFGILFDKLDQFFIPFEKDSYQLSMIPEVKYHVTSIGPRKFLSCFQAAK